MAEDQDTTAVPPPPTTTNEQPVADQPSAANSGLPDSSTTSAPATPWWMTQPTTPDLGEVRRLALARTLWAFGTAIVMAMVWLLSSPDQTFWNLEVDQVTTLADINNESAEGAPQQTVVNGWQQADLLEIQIQQNADLLARQAQIAALLLVLGIGVSGDMALRALSDRKRSTAS